MAVGPRMGFRDDTAVDRIGPNRFATTLHERWLSLVGIHGGYSAAIVTRAIEAAVNDPARQLRSIAVQFASPPRSGAAEVEVHVEREGRSVTNTSARLVQDGRVRLVAHAVSSPARPGLAYNDLVHPSRPEPGDAPLFVPPGRIAHFQNAEVRLNPAVVPFGGGDHAWIAAWIRPLDEEPIDAAWVVAMCDVLPPSVFSRTTGPVTAASIEYVVHLSTATPHLPPGSYAYLDCRSPLSSDGFAVEDAALWGPSGEVLAVARQTRLAGLPTSFDDADSTQVALVGVDSNITV